MEPTTAFKLAQVYVQVTPKKVQQGQHALTGAMSLTSGNWSNAAWAAKGFSSLREKKVHGLAIPKDVKKTAQRLESGDRDVVAKRLEETGKRLASWNTCAGRGSGCKPHRDATIAVLDAYGVPIPQSCVTKGGKANCKSEFADVQSAYLAARFPSEGQSMIDMGSVFGGAAEVGSGGTGGFFGALSDLTKLGVSAYASNRSAKAAEETRRAVQMALGAQRAVPGAATAAAQTPAATPTIIPSRDGASWDPAFALGLALGGGAGSDGDRAGSTVVVPGASGGSSTLLLLAAAAIGAVVLLRR